MIILVYGAFLCACAAQTPSTIRNPSLGFPVPADTQILSQMDDSTLQDYLKEWDISVPEGVELLSVRALIKELEADPDKVLVVGWTPIEKLFEELRVMVKDYYHIDSSTQKTVAIMEKGE